MITTGSSMQAITLTAPPRSRQVSMSILKTRFRRCAQLIEARRSAGVRSCGSSTALGLLPLPRFAGVTDARCLLFGANTPWNLESWRQVFSEDIFVVEGMQKARYSPAFTGGVFSAVMDVPSHHFHQWVAERYRERSDESG